MLFFKTINFKNINYRKIFFSIFIFLCIWLIFCILSFISVSLSPIYTYNNNQKLIDYHEATKYINDEIDRLKITKSIDSAIDKLSQNKTISMSEKTNLLTVIKNYFLYKQQHVKDLYEDINTNSQGFLSLCSDEVKTQKLELLKTIISDYNKQLKEKTIKIKFIKKEFDFIHSEPMYKIEILQEKQTYSLICDEKFFNKKKDFLEESSDKISFSYVKYTNLLRVLLGPLVYLSSIIFTFYILSNIIKSSGKLNTNPLISSKQKSLFTFKDVAGNEEEKEEMKELIDFLKRPQKYTAIGAQIPKGVLLEGPPGTGKTLLAKALAGEAGVPFYAVSGSEFVEMYVGVGASRVRKLFQEAKYNAPCILFIDEIDVLGGKRGGGNLGSGSQEKDQTLNQLLTEMDGFTKSKGIIIIGATNRADMLDSALLRPGRFDRKFIVGLPDVKAREAILKVHARNKNISPDINFHQLAKQTPGMSGAQLEAVLNEASILTIRNQKEMITMLELEEAIDRVLMGPAKKSIKYTEEERKMVAYHEAGHAIIGLKLPHALKVQKITIIPRGSAGGYNLMMPEKETFFSSKKRMLANIISFLAGRVAEELVFDDVSNGAYDDFKQATKIAKLMVTKYGMSDLGVSQDSDFSDKKAIDIEIKKIIDTCYSQAQQIIKENKPLLDKIVALLLEQETITKGEIDKLV